MTLSTKQRTLCFAALGTFLVAIALLANGAPVQAGAVGIRTIKNDALIGQGSRGGGVLLSNTKGGYYMGRLWNGNNFDVWSDEYANNGQLYRWGRPVASSSGVTYAGGQCFWLGPESDPTPNFPEYLTDPISGHNSSNCSSGQQSSLASTSRPFGNTFNCAPSDATGPMMSRMSKTAQFYYNVTWSQSSTGSSYTYKTKSANANPSQFGAITIAAGTKIKFRYSVKFNTGTSQFAAVYSNVHGWGFVPMTSVDIATGWYGSDNGTTEYKCGSNGTGTTRTVSWT